METFIEKGGNLYTVFYSTEPQMLASIPMWYLLFPSASSSHRLTRQVNTTSAHKVGQQDVQMCNTCSIV